MMATKKAEAEAKRAAKVQGQDERIHHATLRREQFEQENPERFKQVTDLPGGSVGAAHAYKVMGLGVAEEHGSTSFGQMNFEGMDHPATVKTPTKWEDLHPHQQERIKRSLAELGVTHESATRALGASLDQGMMYEQRHTASGRHHSFYAAEGVDDEGVMQPRTRLRESAKANNVPFEQQAIANAITSPQAKFKQQAKTGPNKGKLLYPNDMNATAAITAAKEGRPETARAVPGVGGIHQNSVSAAKAVVKMRGGASAAESWSPGEKTGPYHNSWMDPHGPSQFWVSDIHSGGAVAPHLSIPEREKMLGITGIHAFNDHVARQVLASRGIQSMTGGQSAQWNQERRDRGLMPKEPPASAPKAEPTHHPDQMSLFGGDHLQQGQFG